MSDDLQTPAPGGGASRFIMPWLVARLAADYVLQRLRLTGAMFESDLTTALVAATVSQANLGHLARDPELARRWGAAVPAPPPHLRRPISAYAVAAALALPRETVRRKIKALIAMDFLEELPDGLVVRDERAGEPLGLRMLDQIYALTEVFCADLARAGLAAPQPREPDGPPRVRVTALATTAFLLRFFEDLNIVARDQLTGLTVLAATVANTRHLDWRADPAPFRDGMPSLAHRRPITALALASDLGLPRETVRRQVRKLVKMGVAQLAAGGVLVDPAGLAPVDAHRFVTRTEANARRLLGDLRGTGLV